MNTISNSGMTPRIQQFLLGHQVLNHADALDEESTQSIEP